MNKNQNIVITSGTAYIDIDVLACAISYAEFLKLRNINAETVLLGDLNETVPQSVRNWDLKFVKDYQNKKSSFILVDVSNPDFLSKKVELSNVIEVWDHRKGHENYWQEKLKENAHIETVGACATLIWEQFKKYNLGDKISTTSANLLYTAIFSNTLNLRSRVTTERDKKAMAELKQYISLSENWIEKYYTETEESIVINPEKATKNDQKIVKINDKEYGIGQLELWSVKSLFDKNDIVKIAKDILGSTTDLWFLNIPCISEFKNYYITDSMEMQNILHQRTGAKFNGAIGVSESLYLRKELIHKLQDMK